MPTLSYFSPWKCFLSYIYDISIEKTHSPYNAVLEVMLSKGRVRLNGANVTYSYADLYENFSKTFAHLKIEKKQCERVLVLGFGLGSIPYMLERNFGQKAHYIGVEIDAEVLRLAQKYMPADLHSSVNLYCSDAYTFVKKQHGTYDLITVDIFIDTQIPEQFQTADFLKDLKAQLSPKGYLVYNTLTLTYEAGNAARYFFENIFCPTLPEAYSLDLTSNLMLIYQNN